MNARLKKSFGFYTGMVYDRRFMVNHYNVDLDLLTVSRDHEQQNIAYDRVKHWFFEIMDDSLLISQKDPDLQSWAATGARIIAMPDEPVDQLLGIMLYLKLNSIMENRMVVTDVEIWSTQGDSTSYLHSVGEGVGESFSQDGWWVDSRPIWMYQKPRDQGKIVSMDRLAEWKDFDLDWERSHDREKNTVVFANFKRDENK